MLELFTPKVNINIVVFRDLFDDVHSPLMSKAHIERLKVCKNLDKRQVVSNSTSHTKKKNSYLLCTSIPI